MSKKDRSSAFQNVITFEQIIETLTNTIDNKKINHIALAGVDSRSGTSDICNSLLETLTLSHNRILSITVRNDTQNAPSPLLGMDDRFELALKSSKENDYTGTMKIEIFTDELPRPASSQEKNLQDIIRVLEENFDVIIWDLPPTDKSARSRMIAQFTQGAILVVEAGKTRWQTALYAIEHFRYSGVHILGVILNRKKNYIPSWLYKLLFRNI